MHAGVLFTFREDPLVLCRKTYFTYDVYFFNDSSQVCSVSDFPIAERDTNDDNAPRELLLIFRRENGSTAVKCLVSWEWGHIMGKFNRLCIFSYLFREGVAFECEL